MARVAHAGGFGGGLGFAPGRGLPPVTTAVLAACGLAFLVEFFAQRPVTVGLAFLPERLLDRPWTALTYPFVPTGIFALLLLGFVLWWSGGDLERRWGSLELGLFLAAIVVLGALAFFTATAFVGFVPPLAGLAYPVGALVVAWCMTNPRATVHFYMVLPLQARWVAWLDLALIYFGTGPVLGLFALVAPLAAWWYAARGRLFRGLADAVRLRRKLAALDDHRRLRRGWFETLNPLQWWRRRRRRREFEEIARRMGLDEPAPRGDRDRTIN